MERVFILFIGTLLAVFPAVLLAKDAPGSKDHPLLSRYKGAEIKGYNEIDYDEYALGIAPVIKSQLKTKLIEGKITTIVYSLDKKLSTLQVFRNYELALKRHGFKKIFTCTRKNCGHYFPKRLIKGTNSERTYKGVDIYNLSAKSDFRYLSGSFEVKGKLVYVSLLVSKRSNKKNV